MKRRSFLKIAGGAGLILAAGAGGFLSTRTLSKALEPWQQAGSLYNDPLRKALSYALLAPNPHNRQPWLITLESETSGLLTCDLERRLPQTDPFDRQIVIGLGCFLELFDLAARADGYMASIILFPDGLPAGDRQGRLDDRPIARLSLTKQSDLFGDPLFSHAQARHTNRKVYAPDRAVPGRIQEDIISSGKIAFGLGEQGDVGFVTEPRQLDTIRSITTDAILVEENNHAAHMESVGLMRIGVNEVERNPDGISLYGPLPDSLKYMGMLDREALADPNSMAFKSGLAPMLEATSTSPAFLWINTKGNDRVAQITAGRAYMRVCLAATSHGLSMQPVSQSLQEYADMATLYEKLHAELAPDGTSRVQMLARIGYGPEISPSPRWPLSSRTLT